MTSRERVQLALNHQEPDRVPMDLGGAGNTGIMVTTYAKLRKKLGINGNPPKIADLLQMIAEVEIPVVEKLGCDVVGIRNIMGRFGIPHDSYKPWRTFDGTHVLAPEQFHPRVDENGDLLISPGGDDSLPPSGKMPKDGYYFDIIIRQKPFDWNRLNPDDYAEQFKRLSDYELEQIAKKADYLYRNTNFALLANFGGGALGDITRVMAPELKDPQGIRNYDDFLVAHLTHPEFIKGIYALQTARAIENLELYRQAVGDRIVAIHMSGADFGTQRGTFFSPDLYREIYQPFHKQMNDWVHTHTNWKTFYHSCGSIYDLIPDLIEAGVDILNPVQCSAHGMDPARLKKQFGDRLVFWGGGADTQKTLPFGAPENVRQEVTERIRIFAPGGGYIFNAVHNIQAKTPVENILTMYETAREAGRYPINL